MHRTKAPNLNSVANCYNDLPSTTTPGLCRRAARPTKTGCKKISSTSTPSPVTNFKHTLICLITSCGDPDRVFQLTAPLTRPAVLVGPPLQVSLVSGTPCRFLKLGCGGRSVISSASDPAVKRL